MYLNNMTNMQKNKKLSFLWGIHCVNIFQYFTLKFYNINYIYATLGFCFVLMLYLVQFGLILTIDIDNLSTTPLKVIWFFITISPTIIVLILNFTTMGQLEKYIKEFRHQLKKENI